MEKVKLKEICTLLNGRAYKQNELLDDGKYPVLRVGNFFSDKDFYYSDLELDDDKYCDTGDLLFAWSASFGPKIWDGGKVIYHYHIWKMVLTDRVKRDYLYYYLIYLSERIKNEGHGGIMIHTTKTEMEEREFNLPSLEEQDEIASLLAKVQNIIRLRKEELNQLDNIIKARFVEMFGDPVENPKGYRVDTLQALIDAGDITYNLDGNHGGDYPRSEEFVSEGVPYIGANCISNGEIDFSLAKYLTEERAGKLKKGIAQNEDVLFAHNATVGPTVVLHTTESKVILSTSLTAYRCNKASIMPEYLATYMKSDGFIMQYSSEMKQTTRNQVPITAQKKYLFLIPPMVEQKAFAEFVKQVDKSKVVVQKALDEAQLLFDSLMQEYFG